MRALIGLTLGFSILLVAQNTPGTRYGKAIRAFNDGRIPEARSLLEQLLADHPDYYRGYSVYWDTVARTGSSDARKAVAARDLPRFEQAPFGKRDEDFYQNFVAGYRLLGNAERVASIEAECIGKFPRGTLAQSKLLAAARAEVNSDAVRAAALYTAYLKDFDDNVSWTSLAARDRFRVVSDNATLFEPRVLLAAAEEREYRSKQFIGKFGNPAAHLAEMMDIVRSLVLVDPESALNYARRGIAFVQEQWPQTDEIQESARISFWPPMLEAHLARKEWKPAARVGAALVGELESARTPTPILTEKQETTVRMQYATALENVGEAQLARLQREVAANPERNRQRREQQVRDALLSRRQQRPAPPLALTDTGGKSVTLEQLRGRTVVLIFWATWCGPCIGELDELQSIFSRYEKDGSLALLAISVDTDKDAVPKLAAERGYRFPIFLSDGSIEKPYQTQTIPQLYVIDPKGHVRFHETGYSRDGLYGKRLDWMIESARE